MLKTIDKFILKRFFGPFLLTLGIVTFIFVCVTFIQKFKYFVGKDLGLDVYIEVFSYFSVVITPIALPLAVLLASLMSFGSLGQHSELTAIKGSGISLVRILIPAGIFVTFITIGAFFFNDTISPVANLKAYSMLYDVKQKKPTLQLNEGEFYNGLPGYSIKVDSKTGKDGSELQGMMIYNHSSKKGNTDLIISERGRMYSYGNDEYLVLELLEGSRYTELSAERNRRHESEYVRNDFDSSRIVFSMASFGLKKTKEELFKNHNMMKTSRQLSTERDSLVVMGDNLFGDLPGRIQGYHQYQYFDENEERKITQQREAQERIDREGVRKQRPEGNAKDIPDPATVAKKLVVDKKTVKLTNPRSNSIIEELLARKRKKEALAAKNNKNKVNPALKEKLDFARSKLNKGGANKQAVKNTNTTNTAVEKDPEKKNNAESKNKAVYAGKKTENIKKQQPVKNKPKNNLPIIKDNPEGKVSIKELRRGQEEDPMAGHPEEEEGMSTKILKDKKFRTWDEEWGAPPSKRILNMAWSKANGMRGTLVDTQKRIDRNTRKLADYKIALYMKASQSIAVFIMFLIGAPLGAIIKKGGLGVPVLISIIFFVIFYISNIMGKKLAEELVVSPLVGVWSGNALLFAIGLFCLRQAYNDVRLFDLDYYKVILNRGGHFISKLFGKKDEQGN